MQKLFSMNPHVFSMGKVFSCFSLHLKLQNRNPTKPMIARIFTLFLISGVLMSFSSGENPEKLGKKVQRIHDKCLTVDTHSDFTG